MVWCGVLRTGFGGPLCAKKSRAIFGPSSAPGVQWDFLIEKRREARLWVCVKSISFVSAAISRWESVPMQSSVEVWDVLPTSDLNLVNNNMPSGDHFGNCVCFWKVAAAFKAKLLKWFID